MSELFIDSTFTFSGISLISTACVGHNAGPATSTGGAGSSSIRSVEVRVLSVMDLQTVVFSTVKLAGLLLHSTVKGVPGTTNVEPPEGAPQLDVALQFASAILNAPVKV